MFCAVGELDLATAPELEAAVLPAAQEGREIVLDLRGLEFIDSSGVRVVVSAHTAAQTSGGSVVLLRPPPNSPVQRVLEVSGLDGILAFVEAD